MFSGRRKPSDTALPRTAEMLRPSNCAICACVMVFTLLLSSRTSRMVHNLLVAMLKVFKVPRPKPGAKMLMRKVNR
jgi:hypothetical protein